MSDWSTPNSLRPLRTSFVVRRAPFIPTSPARRPSRHISTSLALQRIPTTRFPRLRTFHTQRPLMRALTSCRSQIRGFVVLLDSSFLQSNASRSRYRPGAASSFAIHLTNAPTSSLATSPPLLILPAISARATLLRSLLAAHLDPLTRQLHSATFLLFASVDVKRSIPRLRALTPASLWSGVRSSRNSGREKLENGNSRCD